MIRRVGVFGAVVGGMLMMAWGCGDDSTTTESTSSSSTVGSGGAGTGGMATSSSTSGPVTSSSTSGGGGMSDVTGNCAMPYAIVPGDDIWGDTNNGTDDLSGPCQAGSDVETVFSFTADATGTMNISLTSNPDLGIYVRTACEDPDSVIACVDSEFGDAAVETLLLNVENGTTYYLVVDGYELGQAGNFQLDTDPIAVEICDNMMDDNGNLVADCEDPGCAADPVCTAPIGAACMAPIPLTPGTQQSGDTTNGTNLFAGSCSGFSSPEVLYSYTPAQDELMSIFFQSATDQGLYMRTTCETADTQLGCADAFEGGTDEVLSHMNLTNGMPVTLFVDGYMGGNQGPYTLTAETAVPNEAEPNDDYMTANAFAAGFIGYITAGEDDWVNFSLATAGNVTFETSDVFAGDCANRRIDTEIELFEGDGMTSIDSNDDIDGSNMGNWCSTLTQMNLAAGNYYVRVSSSAMYCPTCSMGYGLTITVN